MKDLTHIVLSSIADYRKQAEEWICPAYDIVLNNKLYQHPVDFEKRYGLEGVSQLYTLPEGLTAADLQTYALLLTRQAELTAGQRLDRMAEAWSIITAYNPELEKISYSPQDAAVLYHMIMGVASAFNVNDIRHYISSPSPRAERMEKTAEFIKLTEVFNRYAGNLDLKWVAAPETLRLIQDKIINKYSRDF